MKKYLLSAFVAFFSLLSFAQNVEFKAANFKDDKEGLKKAEEAAAAAEAQKVMIRARKLK